MDRDELAARLEAELRDDPRVRAAWLTGSLARGTADEFSDVDVWAVVDPDRFDEFVAAWPEASERVSPLVLREMREFGRAALFNHVTPDWLRFDLALETPDAVARRPASSLRLLFDRDGLAAGARAGGQPLAPSPKTVQRLVTEFLRVLGLLPVVIGREDYVNAVSGAALLRQTLVQLMIEDVAVEDPGGALHLSALLPPERYAVLARLPGVEATRESAIAAHVACAQAFLPLARELTKRCELAWPVDLERAARAHIYQRLGVDFD